MRKLVRVVRILDVFAQAALSFGLYRAGLGSLLCFTWSALHVQGIHYGCYYGTGLGCCRVRSLRCLEPSLVVVAQA